VTAEGATYQRVLLHWSGSIDQLDSIGLGLPRIRSRPPARPGLNVVARLRNYPGINSRAITFMLDEAKRQGATILIPDQQEVLGYKDLLRETASGLRDRDISYGSVEFGKQLGDAGLGRSLHGQLVRVHSITDNEMPTMSPQRAIDRFELAVTDRNQRVCYVRLFEEGRDDPLGYNVAYLSGIASALRRDGFTWARRNLSVSCTLAACCSPPSRWASSRRACSCSYRCYPSERADSG